MTKQAPTGIEVGAIFGRLTVLALDRVDGHWRKYWECRCECGTEVSVRGDHLLRREPATRSCGCLNRELAVAKGKAMKGRRAWHKSIVGYRSAHSRVHLRRGPASKHLCDCGRSAEDWAYDHADPDECTENVNGAGWMAVYSLDPEHYVPMCKPCHASFDYDRRYSRETS